MENSALRASYFFVCLMAYTLPGWAVDCDDIFAGGVQSNTGSGNIVVASNVDIDGSGTILNTSNLSGGNGACDNSNCSASGSPGASSSPAFQAGNGSDGNINVGNNNSETVGNGGDNQFQEVNMGNNNSSLTFSFSQSVYYFQKGWDVRGTVTLAPGDYWIEESVIFNANTDIVISPAGTVRFYVKKSIDVKSSVNFNNPGSAGQLLIYAQESISVASGTTINGFLYADKAITLESSTTINGAVSAAETLDIKSNVTINYVAPSAGGDFGDFCEGAAAGVDHYAITHSGTALTCEPLTVTIEARDATNNPIAPAASTMITLSTSIVVDAWSPSTIYTFTGAESSTTFELSQSTAGTVDIDVSDGVATDPDDGGAEDQRPNFLDTALRFVEDNGSGGFDIGIDNQVAGTASPSSGSNTLYLEAVENSQLTNPSAPVQCVGAFPPNASVDVDLAAECKNPSSCAGVAVFVTNNSITGGVATSADDTVASMVANYTTRSLQFDANSRALLIINYADVGQMQLHARAEALDGEGNGFGFFISGLSNDFVVSPYSLVITAVETDSAASGSNPGTTNTGAGFIAAGDTFYMTLEAQDSAGDITPNYGNESSAEGILIQLDSTLVYPAGGALGFLTNPSTFTSTSTPGEFANATLSWSEVGTIRLEAHVADGSYLGTGDVISVNTSGNIGRFYPNHFNVAATVTDACAAGNFSYMNQDNITVNVILEARAFSGNVVNNYDNDSLTYNASTVTFYGENNGNGSDFIGRISAPFLSPSPKWISGRVLVDSGPSPGTFTRAGAPDGPYSHMQLGVVVSDTLDSRAFDTALDFNPAASGNFSLATSADGCISDGNCTGKKLGDALDLRYGRLITANSHGPEAAPLPVKLQVEYWNGSLFVVNVDDNSSSPPSGGCTSLLRSRFLLDSADTTTDFTVNVGTGSSTGGFTVSPDVTDLFMSMGNAGLVFSAPTVTGSFPLQVINVEAWLQFDWNQDGNYTDTNLPVSTISFGSYRGHDRVIYWREVFNN